MSRSDWLKHPTARLVGGLVVAVLSGALILGYGHLESAEYERQANAKSREYARYTSKKVAESCIGISGLERTRCFYDAANAKAEYDYNQADLVAQRQSALWAYIMAFAAVIGMVLSAVGVWLVWTTFRATKQANVIARDALESQTRPWIKLEAQVGMARMEGATIKARVRAKAINLGNAPANFVSIVPMMLDGEWPTPRILNSVPTYFGDGQVRDLNLHDRILFQQEDWTYECDVEATNVPENCRVGCVVVSLRYSAPGYIKPRYTTLVFDMNWRTKIKLNQGVREAVEVMVFKERASFSAYAD